MLKSSLLEIIRTFTKEELMKFEDFVRSPYFNKKENVTKLFLEIKKFAPEFTDGNLEKEKIWLKLFPGKEYNYGIIKNLIFDLNKMAVSFLDLEKHSGKKFVSEINILEQYFSRGLFNSFRKKNSDIQSHISNKNLSFDLFNQKHILGNIELQYFISADYTSKNCTRFDYDSLNRNLVLRFFTEYFFLSIHTYMGKILFNINPDKSFSENLISLYLKSDFKNYYTEIFYFMFKCFYDQDNEENYFELKKLFFENIDKLNNIDILTVIEALIFYCLHKTNRGATSFSNERFQYHKILDERNLLLSNSKNPLENYYLFLDTNVAACTAGEFEWAEKFIEKYKSKLDPDKSETLINLAFTHLYFKKNRFEEALQYLSKCRNAYGADKINIKTYEAHLYYELEYYEELKNLIDTSRHYINNDKAISDEVKLIFGKFIEALNKLNEYRYKKDIIRNDSSVLSVIKNYILKTEMPHKGWLLKKVSELE